MLGSVSTFENIFLQHEAIRYTSESKWISLFPLEINVYNAHLDGVRLHQRQINRYLGYCENEAKENDNNEIRSILRLLRGQMQYVTNKCHNLREHMNTFKKMLTPDPPRTKRSLFPFLGNILHGLAGVPTEDDMNRFNQHLNELELHDNELTHIIKDSLTIVNVTKYQLNHVSETVNSMNTAMQVFQDTVYNSTEEVYDDLGKLELNFRCWGHNSALITTLLHNLDTVNQHIQTLDVILTDILQGQLTVNVLPPNQLRKLLLEIKHNIAQDLKLPFDIESNLLQYYQTTQTYLISTDQGPAVVITIPLKSIMTQFHLYQITHVPIPYRNTSLLLHYDIQYPYVALSRDNTQIVYLNEREYYECIQPTMSLCHFKSPSRFIEQVKDECSAVILTQKTVSKCKIKLSPNNLMLPQSHWLSEGKWWIISVNKQVFTVLCITGKRYTTSIDPPIGILKLPVGCKAQSSYLSIPPSYHHKENFTMITLDDFIKYNVSVYDTLVGNKIAHVALNLPELLPTLVDTDMDISTLESRIDRHLKPINPSRFDKHYQIWLPMVLLLSILCLIALYAYIRYFRPRLSNQTIVYNRSSPEISLNESLSEASELKYQAPTNVFANTQ